MSFAGAQWLGQPGGMAKIEIMKRTANPYRILIWRYRLKSSIVLNWPHGWAVLNDDGQGGLVSAESSDPNVWYRTYLTSYVGRQGWDWEWRTYNHDKIEIKFRRAADATMFALKYS